MTLSILRTVFDQDNVPIGIWLEGNVSKHWIGAGWYNIDELDEITIICQGKELIVKETMELIEVLKDL